MSTLTSVTNEVGSEWLATGVEYRAASAVPLVFLSTVRLLVGTLRGDDFVLLPDELDGFFRDEVGLDFETEVALNNCAGKDDVDETNKDGEEGEFVWSDSVS